MNEKFDFLDKTSKIIVPSEKERNINENKRDENIVEVDKCVDKLDDLKNRIKTKIRDKSIELDISEEDTIELIGLDFERFDSDLSALDKEELENWENDTNDLIDSLATKENRHKFSEFLRKHKRVISFSTLALYCSTFGSAIAKDLVDTDIKLDHKGKKVPVGDVVNHPDFREAVREGKYVPIDVLQAYSASPLLNEEGFAVSFVISGDEESGKKIGISFMGSYWGRNASESVKTFERIRSLILNIRKGKTSSNWATEKLSLEEFQSNRQMIIKEISSAMHISEKEVSSYFDSIFESLKNPEEKVSVVPLENFKINRDFEPNGKVTEKYLEIISEYNSIKNDSEKEKTREKLVNEFVIWGKENGYKDVWKALVDEKLNNPFLVLESHETRGVMVSDVYGKFLVKELKNKGYKLDELKKDPQKAKWILFSLIIERQGVKNEKVKSELRKSWDIWCANSDIIEEILNGKSVSSLPSWIDLFEEKNIDSNFKNLIIDSFDNYGYDLDKLNEIAQKNPEKIISLMSSLVVKEFGKDSGFGSYDQSNLFMAVKHSMMKMGIENLDKFVVVQSVSEEGHVVSNLITVDSSGKFEVSSIDFSSIVNKHTSREDLKVDLEKAHNSILKKIKEVNIREVIGKIIKKSDTLSTSN